MNTALQVVRWDAQVSGIDGPNERCIEIPLALEVLKLDEPGWVLDAGCALNGHLYVPTQPRAFVVHLTQAIASEPIHAKGASPLSYVSADLRDLRIFANKAFDRTVCVSTLEHVGLDNTSYYGREEHDPDSVWTAVSELLRITRGQLLITVPFAREPWTNGRFAYWTEAERTKLQWCAVGCAVDLRYYRRTDNTWGSCDPADLPPPGESVRGILAARIDCA